MPSALIRPDGETEIIPRFYRGVPGSSPGRATEKTSRLLRQTEGQPDG
jgi:hypothetical protein